MKKILALFCLVCFLFVGCATTGSVPSQITEQSAAVDTGISTLQGQQAESAATVQAVTDTTANVVTIAQTIGNDKLTAEVTKLQTQVGKLNDELTTERATTADIQQKYSALKITSGETIANQAGEITALTAQRNSARAWVWRLGIILAGVVLCTTAYVVLKIKKIISF